MTDQIPKGFVAEEALRNYFLSIGYFVVRGCKFTFNQFDVTDVDLWLYARNSPLSRQRVCVDVKNKKTPQALERIFWAKGLQAVLGLDSCVVATTDTRADIREFGLQHNVQVLDGKFLARLTKSARSQQDRITEEQLFAELEDGSLGRLSGDWKGRYEESKSRLLKSLDFDGCNAWLEDVRYILEQVASGVKPWRLLYMSCAHLLICVDFILREHVTADHEQRRSIIEQGIRYGASGQAFTDRIGRMAAALVESVVAQPGLSETVRRELHHQAANVKADVLAEFFAKNGTGTGFFGVAVEFEAAAFTASVPMPSTMSSSAQSVIGVLADFCAIDRKLAIA